MTQQVAERSRFNPQEHLMQLQGKDYLEVKWRLVWFREQCPEGVIETEMLHLDLDRETEEEAWVWNNETRKKEKIIKRAKGYCIFRAIVKDGKGGVGTGTKSEKAASFPDFIEKAESGSIGRALATLGYGTQFTGDELAEANRIVDSPVARPESQQHGNGNKVVNLPVASAKPSSAPSQSQQQGENWNAEPTEQQQAAIEKLCQHLGKTEPKPATYLEAKTLIAELSEEYRKMRAGSKA